ncbi:hypothetical protein QO179_05000 [Bacillus stercoris]|nr:hypothetical protein [Bacillus stercoris]
MVSRVTKYISIVHVPAKQVFSDAVCVFDLPSWASFATLQCSFHELWVRRESSTMKRDIRYTPSNCFDTYPFLHIENAYLDSIGRQYHDLRGDLMSSLNVGLTEIHNRFHNPEDVSEDIKKLRELHVKMDMAVAQAYGWVDLNLEHDFRETKWGVRYTISDMVSREVLQRLLELNRECYEQKQKSRSTRELNRRQFVVKKM